MREPSRRLRLVAVPPRRLAEPAVWMAIGVMPGIVGGLRRTPADSSGCGQRQQVGCDRSWRSSRRAPQHGHRPRRRESGVQAAECSACHQARARRRSRPTLSSAWPRAKVAPYGGRRSRCVAQPQPGGGDEQTSASKPRLGGAVHRAADLAQSRRGTGRSVARLSDRRTEPCRPDCGPSPQSPGADCAPSVRRSRVADLRSVQVTTTVSFCHTRSSRLR